MSYIHTQSKLEYIDKHGKFLDTQGWRASHDGNECTAWMPLIRDGQVVALVLHKSEEYISDLSNTLGEEARRIVACVNACSKVDTETLENSPDLASAFISAENARLIQQNKALTNNLKDLISRFKSCISGRGEIAGDLNAINTALKVLETAVSK